MTYFDERNVNKKCVISGKKFQNLVYDLLYLFPLVKVRVEGVVKCGFGQLGSLSNISEHKPL